RTTRLFVVFRTSIPASWILSFSVVLLLLPVESLANICIQREASVSRIRGQAKYVEKELGGIPVELWGTERNIGKTTLIAKTVTDSSGNFSFSKIPSGSYLLVFPEPGFDNGNFLIH